MYLLLCRFTDVVQEVPAIVATSNTMLVEFVTVKDNAILAGMEVYDMGQSTTQIPPPTVPPPVTPAPTIPPTTPTTPTTPNPSGTRAFTITNKCAEPVWVAILGKSVVAGGGFQLAAGQGRTVAVPENWQGRMWGKTGCKPDGTSCESGSSPPATLAEFQLAGWQNLDFYDISLVDGFNLPMVISLKTTRPFDPAAPYSCGAITCAADINAVCPKELQVTNAAGKVVACKSACAHFKTDQYCCGGAYGCGPTCCPPTNYSRIFKTACPTSYSYAYDDQTSTFTCVAAPPADYDIQFCS